MFWSNPVNAERLNKARLIAMNIGHHDEDMETLLLQNGVRKNDSNYTERVQKVRETTMCAFQILREIKDLKAAAIEYTIRDPKPAQMAKLQREFLQLITAKPCYVNVHAHLHIMSNHSLQLLHQIPKTGMNELIEPLIAAGAKVDTIAPRTHQTPLNYAIRNGNLDAVKRLLKAGANPNGVGNADSPLAIAVQHSNPEMIYALCAAGADPNLPACLYEKRDQTVQIPLDYTYTHRDKATVMALFTCGANPNQGHVITEEMVSCYIRNDDIADYLQTLIGQGSSLVQASMANSLMRTALAFIEGKLPCNQAMVDRMQILMETINTHWIRTEQFVDALPLLRERCESPQHFASLITPQHFIHAAGIERLEALLHSTLWRGAEKELMDTLSKLPPWLTQQAVETAPWIGTITQHGASGGWTARIEAQREDRHSKAKGPTQ